MYLTDLNAAVRKSGLPVETSPGWQTRGHGGMTSVESVIVHHTATAARTPGKYPSLRIVRDGRSDLAGPLSQLGLGRDGTVYVIAAGLAYHAGVVGNDADDNARAIGIEAEHPGVGPWSAVQYDAYVRLCAALVDHYGLTPADVKGHKEVAYPPGRKADPSFDMALFRKHIADTLRDAETELLDKKLRGDLTAAIKDAKHRPTLAERLRNLRRALRP